MDYLFLIKSELNYLILKKKKKVILIVTNDLDLIKYFNNINVDVIIFEKNKTDNIIVEKLIEKNINLNIVFKFNILPKKIWNLPLFKTLNIHYSLLYSYAGPNPLEWQLHNNEKITGVTILFISDKIDNGPIIVQEKININNKLISIIKKDLDNLSRKCILKAINLIEKYKMEVPIIQSKYKYSYYSFYE